MRLNKFIHRKTIENALRATPLLNFFYASKMSRYLFPRFIILTFLVIPFIGIFRRASLKQKLHKQIQSQAKATEVLLKESLNQLEVDMNPEDDYMVVIICDRTQNSQLDNEYIEEQKKVFMLAQQIKENPVASQIRWVLLGNKDNEELAKDSGIQFHERKKAKGRVAKVYLLAKDQNDQSKVLMDWSLGIPFFAINKYISRHRHKKYLQSVNF